MLDPDRSLWEADVIAKYVDCATKHRLNSREDKWAAYGVGQGAVVTDTAPDGMVQVPQPVSGD